MKPNCMKCKHYYITFEKATPKGCRTYQIKSAAMPSQIVKQANNGNECIGFTPKNETNTKAGKKDLNDPKYW